MTYRVQGIPRIAMHQDADHARTSRDGGTGVQRVFQLLEFYFRGRKKTRHRDYQA